MVMTRTSSHFGLLSSLHQQCGSAFVYHLWVHVQVVFHLDFSVYWRYFSIWHPSDQFCHMIGMWSPWQDRRLCQVHGILCDSCMHVGSGGSVFLLMLMWARLRLLAPFVDSMDSFGLETHNIEVVCYGYLSPACFEHLGCCGFKVKSEQFLDQVTVCEATD